MWLRLARSGLMRVWEKPAPRSWKRASGSASRCQMMIRMERPTATMARLAPRRRGGGAEGLAQEGVGPAGGRGGLPEHAGQIRVAVAGGALALGLACGLLDTRGEAGPGGQMARGGETTHVH